MLKRGRLLWLALAATLLAACAGPGPTPAPTRSLAAPTVGGAAPTPQAVATVVSKPAPAVAPRPAPPGPSAPSAPSDDGSDIATLPADTPPISDGSIQLYAAPIFGPALQELVGGYLRANQSAPSLQLQFGALSKFRSVVSAGGTEDLVASDDAAQMQALQAANLLVGEPRVFARGRLSMVVPIANPKNIAGVKDLARPGVRWMISQTDPLAAATARMLDRASSQADYEPTFRTQAERNIQARTQGPGELLDRIADSEADAGVVYVSDVPPGALKELQVIEIPDQINELVDYSIAVLQGPNAQAAQTFMAYVLSPPAQAVFKKYSFGAPPAD